MDPLTVTLTDLPPSLEPKLRGLVFLLASRAPAALEARYEVLGSTGPSPNELRPDVVLWLEEAGWTWNEPDETWETYPATRTPK